MWYVPAWVTLIEFAISGATQLSLGIFLRVLRQLRTIHPNLRVLLWTVIGAVAILTVSYFMECAYNIFGTSLPERNQMNDHRLLQFIWFNHEFGYAFASFTMLNIIIERRYAIFNSEEYAKQEKVCIFIHLAIALSALCSMIFAYLVHYCDIHILPTTMINTVEVICLFLAAETWHRSHNMWVTMTPPDLNSRYQVVEVLTMTMALIPAIIFGVSLKLISMIFIWRMIFQDGHALYYSEIVSIYCLFFPWLLMMSHRKMYRHVRHIVTCGGYDVEAAERRELHRLITLPSQDQHFSMLNETFSRR